MHIGFISLDYPSSTSGGGVGSQVRTLGRYLARRGNRVTVIALAEPGQPSYLEDEGVKVYRVDQGSLHWYVYKIPWLGPLLALAIRELEFGWAVYRQVWAIHRRTPFDLIEGIEWGTFWLAWLFTAIPLIIRLHGEQYTFCKYTPGLSLAANVRLSRVLQRMAMRRARLLTSPSQAHACEIKGELGQRHPPIEVIPNAVALPAAQKPLAVGKTAEATPLVLFVGRLERVKGIPVLLAAARQVLEEMPQVRFKLIGAPHPTLTGADLEALRHQFSLNGQVEFLGHRPYQEVMLWYRQADICVLPSFYETFGLAALEPMSLGIPVVASRTGGLVEIIEDGVSGLLVPPGDEQILARAILKLLQDPALRTTLSLAGQRRAQSQFNLEQVVEKSLAAYHRVQRHS